MRTFAILGLLDCVIVAMVDDLLISNDHMLHAVHESPAYSTTVSGIYESVLRTCVEGIFTIHELRMKNHVALLRSRFHIRKALPVDKVLGASNTGSGNCRRKVTWSRSGILALYAEDTIDPTVLMCSQTHIIYICRRFTIFRHSDRTLPESEVIHSVRALCHRKERLSVSTLDTNYKDIFSIPFDCSCIEGCMHLKTFHKIWICFLVEVISPEQRSVSCSDNRVHITLIYAIAIHRLIFSGNKGFMS